MISVKKKIKIKKKYNYVYLIIHLYINKIFICLFIFYSFIYNLFF